MGRAVPYLRLVRVLTVLVVTAVYALLLLRHLEPLFANISSSLLGDERALVGHLGCAWQWTGEIGEILSLPTMYPYDSGLSFGAPLVGVVWLWAPVYWITGNTVLTFNLAVLGSFFLLAVAVFLLTRELFDSGPAGLLAAMLALFVPLRIEALGALELLSIYYAVFGMWLILWWLDHPRWWKLVVAAVLFHLQLVSTPQVGIAAVYTAGFWLLIVFSTHRLGYLRGKYLHVGAGLAVFFGLSLAWLPFFAEPLATSFGLFHSDVMFQAGPTLLALATLVGAVSPLGLLAAVGLFMGWFSFRLGLEPRPDLKHNLGGLLGAALIMAVLSLGPYLLGEEHYQFLPGLFAGRYLPFLGAISSPAQMVVMVPVILAVLAGGAAAGVIGLVEGLPPFRDRQWPKLIWVYLPLLSHVLWPALPTDTVSPITQRPSDLALAEAIAELPPEAVVLVLPLDFDDPQVDEMVLVHHRRQVGGVTPFVPQVLKLARARLGQWPQGGHEVIAALGVTHVVAPAAWHTASPGYQRLEMAGGHGIYLAPAPPPVAAAGDKIDAPDTGATNRWMTVARIEGGSRGVILNGHDTVTVRWHPRNKTREEHTTSAVLLYPGLVGVGEPERYLIPTPERTGRYRLDIEVGEAPIQILVDIRPMPTTVDKPIHAGSIELSEGFSPPGQVRRGGALRLPVTVKVGPGPVWLANSLEDFPERWGQATLAYRYTTGEVELSGCASPVHGHYALSRDLAPGETAQLIWYVPTPTEPGSYALALRVEALGLSGNEMPWQPLISSLVVE